MDLVAKTFSAGRGYWPFLDHCRQGYMDGAHYDWSASRIGVVGGAIVTHFGVWDYRMRIGKCDVRVAGIGVVATHAEYRKQGLMDLTARACIDDLAQSGYDMSILFGIRDYYHKFGYVAAWPRTVYTVAIADLPRGRAGRLRRFSPGAAPELDKLYNDHHASLTGTAVRPTYRRNRNGDRWQGYLWRDDRQRAVGYVVVADANGRLECVDACGKPEHVLGVLADLARRRGCNEASFPALHWESGLARALRDGICRVELRYVRSGEAMIRTVNLLSTLRKISPELSARLADSHLADWAGGLTVSDPRQTVALSRTARSRLDVAELAPARRAARGDTVTGGEHVAQLVIGTESPGELSLAGRAKFTGRAAELAEVLFPAQHPMLGAWDAF